MRVGVDHDLCESHGVCEREAPEVFRLGDDEVTQVLQVEPAEEMHEAVRRAAWGCPKQAIVIE